MATAPAQPNAGDQPSNTTASLLRRNLPRLVAGLLLAVLVISGLALFSDVQSLGSAFRQFDWSLSVPVLLLTLGNYMLRWGKWEVYLRQARVPSMRLVTSALIFLAGFSMSLTPGKVGEVIKGVLVKRETGTPVSKTAAVIAAERITDGLAMLALAVIGLTQFSYGRPLVALTVGGAVAVILVLQRPDMMLALLARFEGNRLAGTVLVHAHHFLATSNVLLRPRLLTAAVAVGILSWGMECLALYLILIGLGLDASWHLLLIATFVLSVSSVFGAISM
ncbi:MAG: lysylphosphatidylglycerol synthase transmembrane domain-containing protein, partial [Thermomicrobiales bacterium]